MMPLVERSQKIDPERRRIGRDPQLHDAVARRSDAIQRGYHTIGMFPFYVPSTRHRRSAPFAASNLVCALSHAT
jgi:hypothetical protein